MNCIRRWSMPGSAAPMYWRLVVRAFTDLYPDEVVGLTLVNTSHPDQWLHMPIPNAKRSEWHGFLADQKAGHLRLMDQIISLETRLNAIVYEAFDLTPEERQLIEDTTKYPYGEV